MMHGDTWTAEHLGSALQQGRDILLLDCRDANHFNTSHIKGAMHVTIPTIILRRMKKTGSLNSPLSSIISSPEDKERFCKSSQSDMVVVYEHLSPDLDASGERSVSNVLVAKLAKEGCRVTHLLGGFESFQREYPLLCTDQDANTPLGTTPTSILGLSNLSITTDSAHTTDSTVNPQNKGNEHGQNQTSVFPVEVLPHLFLGNCGNSADLKCLYKHNIKHIVNVTQDCPNHFENDGEIQYLRIPIKDHWSENLSDFFHQAIVFIESARQHQQGVLIHCLAGISRSVTVTLAYLMHSLNLDLNEAFDYVKRKRANISPNFNFMGQLQDFEKTLKSQRTCTCSCPKRNSFYAGNPVPLVVCAGSSGGAESPLEGAMSDGENGGSKQGKTAENRGSEKGGVAGCKCSCHDLKNYFTSPGVGSGSTYNNSSGSSSFSVTSSGNASSPQFNYDVPPSPS